MILSSSVANHPILTTCRTLPHPHTISKVAQSFSSAVPQLKPDSSRRSPMFKNYSPWQRIMVIFNSRSTSPNLTNRWLLWAMTCSQTSLHSIKRQCTRSQATSKQASLTAMIREPTRVVTLMEHAPQVKKTLSMEPIRWGTNLRPFFQSRRLSVGEREAWLISASAYSSH